MRGLPAIAAVVGLGCAGCGDNLLATGVPLGPADDLAIVAHQDDDLLFMQPDLVEAVQRGTGVTIVYVTAGNGNHGVGEAERRYDGLMVAYAVASGADGWTCGSIELAGHPAEHCRLARANVSLVFVGYPDGGKEGEHPASLLHLWDGSIDSAETVARHPTRYDRAGLVSAIAAVIDAAAPRTVRTLEIAQTHGRDHADHRIAGALGLLAVAASAGNPELVSYRGYNTETEPPNLVEPVFDRSADILAHYAGCASACASCGEPCPALSEAHAIWLHRRYAVAMRRTASGLLRAGARCASADGSGSLELVDCAAAAPWQLAADGTLHVGARCVQTLPTGELIAGQGCAADPSHRFFLDDEGHVWLGTPPIAEQPVDGSYLRCLIVAGDRPRAGLCGASRAPVWELSRTPTSAPHPFPGLPGRAIRLGDVTGDGRADLCAVEAAALRCAPGRGDGSFDAVVRIDQPAAPLAIEPESLAIGDVDGDGRSDACGRDASGISCATAATGFATERWSVAFAHPGPADATDRSLAIGDADADGRGEICGVTVAGVQCAPRGAPALVRSAWPGPSAVVWPGELDGDRRIDWCAATPEGAACSIDAERELTRDGVPWSFAFAGVADPAPADAASGALADIDGDGRADLCSVHDARILCARSQGHGFGPLTTLATLPGAPNPILWLGDLDADGAADACVDATNQITCVMAR